MTVPYAGKVGPRFFDRVGYESLDTETRQRVAKLMADALAVCPPEIQGVRPYVVASWAFGTNWNLSDLDLVFCPDTEDLAEPYRAIWKTHPCRGAIRELCAVASQELHIALSISFGHRPPRVYFDILEDKLHGRNPGEPCWLKEKFNRDTLRYDSFPISVLSHPRGSWVEGFHPVINPHYGHA